MELIIFAIVVVIVLLIIISNISVVQQSRAFVIERLGAFQTVWGVGLHLKVPFIDRIARSLSLPRITLLCRSTPWCISRSQTPSCTATVWSSP